MYGNLSMITEISITVSQVLSISRVTSCVILYSVVVFVLNHATPDDFQPYALKDLHGYIAENFLSSRLLVAGK